MAEILSALENAEHAAQIYEVFMRYSIFALALGVSISIASVSAQNSAKVNSTDESKSKTFIYDDSNLKPDFLRREIEEKAKERMKTTAPCPSSVGTSFSHEVPQDQLMGKTSKEICLRALPKVEASDQSSVKIESDGSAFFAIFPQEGDLKTLTKDKATKLFGISTAQGTENGNTIASYQLVKLTGNGSELDIFHLDCEFNKGDLLTKYRVRGPQISKLEWHEVVR